MITRLRDSINLGETVNVSVDWSRVVKQTGISVSSATWSSESTAVSLGTATLSANISTVPVTNSNQSSGCVTLTNTATLSDGQVLVEKLWITLDDPGCS